MPFTERALKIFTGNANPVLAADIVEHLHVSLGDIMVKKFSDGEVYCQIQENVRGCDVFMIQSTCHPVNQNLMELLIMIDAARRASAERITAVLPYYGYARQDKKDAPRVPITAKLVADMLVAAGADRVLSMDMHAGQIQGFFNVPVDHLFAAPVAVQCIERLNLQDLVLVAPDAGAVERARAVAKRMEAGLAIIDKRRPEPNKAKVMNVIGEVEGRTAFVYDDLVDTAGTLTLGAHALEEAGATAIYAFASHAVLSGPAVERITTSPFQKVVVTDSIPLSEEAKKCSKITTLSVAPLFAEAIRSIHEETSISSLFI
jgi:ribose-phosphate pyrophosphokinase